MNILTKLLIGVLAMIGVGHGIAPDSVSVQVANSCSDLRAWESSLVVPSIGLQIGVAALGNVVVIDVDSTTLSQYSETQWRPFYQLLKDRGWGAAAKRLVIPLDARDGKSLFNQILRARAASAMVRIDYYACDYYFDPSFSGDWNLGINWVFGLRVSNIEWDEDEYAR